MGDRTLRVLAWCLLVIVVAWGFFLQSITIEELKQTQLELSATQDRLRELVERHEARRTADLKQLCIVLLDVADDDAIVSTAFANMGLSCPGGG